MCFVAGLKSQLKFLDSIRNWQLSQLLKCSDYCMCLQSLSEAVITSKCTILLFNHIIVSLMIHNQYRKLEEVVDE